MARRERVRWLAIELQQTAQSIAVQLNNQLRRLESLLPGIAVRKASGTAVERTHLNFVEGSGATITVTDDAANDQVTVQIAASGGGGVSDGDKGDIVVSGSGATWTIDPAILTAAGRAILDDADATAQRATLGAAATSHTHAAADITSGTMATARLGSGTADGTTFLRGDQIWATPATGGGLTMDDLLALI